MTVYDYARYLIMIQSVTAFRVFRWVHPKCDKVLIDRELLGMGHNSKKEPAEFQQVLLVECRGTVTRTQDPLVPNQMR